MGWPRSTLCPPTSAPSPPRALGCRSTPASPPSLHPQGSQDPPGCRGAGTHTHLHTHGPHTGVPGGSSPAVCVRQTCAAFTHPPPAWAAASTRKASAREEDVGRGGGCETEQGCEGVACICMCTARARGRLLGTLCCDSSPCTPALGALRLQRGSALCWGSAWHGPLAPRQDRGAPRPQKPCSRVVEEEGSPSTRHSQLRDVLGDAPGQGLEVLVAAADHGVQAGALLRALGPRDAARLLLTCTGHKEPQCHQGTAGHPAGTP